MQTTATLAPEDTGSEQKTTGKYYRSRRFCEAVILEASQGQWLGACTPVYLRDRLQCAGLTVPSYDTCRLWLGALKQELGLVQPEGQ